MDTDIKCPSVTEGLELVSLFIEASPEYLMGYKKIKTNVLYTDNKLKMNNKIINKSTRASPNTSISSMVQNYCMCCGVHAQEHQQAHANNILTWERNIAVQKRGLNKAITKPQIQSKC